MKFMGRVLFNKCVYCKHPIVYRNPEDIQWVSVLWYGCCYGYYSCGNCEYGSEANIIRNRYVEIMNG